MQLYGKTPQEQAMLRLIHDTNQSFSRFRFTRKIINGLINTNFEKLESVGVNPSEIIRRLIHLEATENDLKNIIDRYYEAFKADFPSEVNSGSTEN